MEKPLAVHTSAYVSMKDDYQKVLTVKFNNIESDGKVLLVCDENIFVGCCRGVVGY